MGITNLSALRSQKIRIATLDNGLTVVVRPFMQLESVTVTFSVRYGDINLPEDDPELLKEIRRFPVTSLLHDEYPNYESALRRAKKMKDQELVELVLTENIRNQFKYSINARSLVPLILQLSDEGKQQMYLRDAFDRELQQPMYPESQIKLIFDNLKDKETAMELARRTVWKLSVPGEIAQSSNTTAVGEVVRISGSNYGKSYSIVLPVLCNADGTLLSNSKGLLTSGSSNGDYLDQ